MLKDVVPVKRKVKFEGGEFEVSGLSLTTLVILMEGFESEINALMMGGKLTISQLINKCPPLMISIIAIASGEYETEGIEEVVEGLPTGVQAEAIEKIFDLTFPDEDWLGKFINRLKSIPNLPAPPESK